MNHRLEDYAYVLKLMDLADEQLQENIISRMEVDFDNSLEETDHKARSKLVKKFHRSVKEVEPFSSQLYPLQIQFYKLRVNLSFLLRCAHNKVSYLALARYFAEYDFLAQEMKKIINQTKHEEIVAFAQRTTVLEENFFDIMRYTASVMRNKIVERMQEHPEEYIDLNIKEDSHLSFDDLKETYKQHLKTLKEKKKKEKQAAKQLAKGNA